MAGKSEGQEQTAPYDMHRIHATRCQQYQFVIRYRGLGI